MKTHLIVNAIALLIVFVSGQKIDTLIPCRQTSDCTNITTLPRNAFCKDGHCMCPNEAKPCSSLNTSMHEKRVAGPLLYRKCKLDQECVFEGGYCNYVTKQCDCTTNYIASNNRQYCVKELLSINAECVDKNQCLLLLRNSTCHDKKCICAFGYYYVNDICWRKVEYGYPCTNNLDCSYIEGVICKNETCRCEGETVLNTNRTQCLAIASHMEKCEDKIQCAFSNLTCINDVCQCKPNYHYENEMTSCFFNRGLDDDCVNDYDCYQTENHISNVSIKSLKCEANKCTCTDNFIRENNRCVNSGSFAVFSSVILSVMALVCSILLL